MKLKFNKILSIVLILFGVSMLVGTVGCNQQIIDLKYKFDRAVIAIPGSGTNKTVRIKRWMDYQDSDMVQVIAEDGTVYYGHSNNILLIKKP